MADITAMPAPATEAENLALLDAMLQEMRLINAQIRRHDAEISRMEEEARHTGERTDAKLAEIRGLLNEMQRRR